MRHIKNTADIRTYYRESSCTFKKNTDEYGGFSNMATNYPLKINDIFIRTSEALYQACKFPHKPDIQKDILNERSPMKAKMISRINKEHVRDDWDNVRIKIMEYCLHVKLAQHYITFGNLLKLSGQKDIVENSAKDDFWGAIPNDNELCFKGVNALGRLLMKLRQEFFSYDCYSLLYVDSLNIKDFLLFSTQISPIDERINFIKYLENYWSLQSNLNINIPSQSLKDSSNSENNINNANIIRSFEKASKKKPNITEELKSFDLRLFS